MDILCIDDKCHLSAELMQETMDNLTKGKTPVIPQFIITYGPPGSGKTSMLEDAIYNNHVDRDHTVEINVDEIISNFEQYKRDLTKVQELLVTKKKVQARDLAIKAYRKYRQTAATLSDFILNIALLNRYNIIWETTGADITWSVKEIERIRRYGYKIIIVYPFVDTENLKERVEKRGWATLRFLDSDYVQRVSINAQKKLCQYRLTRR